MVDDTIPVFGLPDKDPIPVLISNVGVNPGSAGSIWKSIPVKDPFNSNVTASKSVLSQIVWSKVVLTEVTVTVAFGTIVIFPGNVAGSQDPEVVTVKL